MSNEILPSIAQFVRDNPSAIALFDQNMCYLAASDRWLTDYNITTDPIGVSHYSLFPNLPARLPVIHRRGLAGQAIRAVGEPFERPDGTALHVDWLVSPWYSANGEIGGIIIAAQNFPETAREPNLAAVVKDALARSAAPREVQSGLKTATQLNLVDQLRFANLVLADMPDELFNLIRDSLTPTVLEPGEILVDEFRPISKIVFPLQGLYSVIRHIEDGSSVELINTGRCVHGALAVLSEGERVECETLVVVGGAALSMPAQRLRSLLSYERRIVDLLQGHFAAFTYGVERTAGCVAHHTIRQRMAGWLLLASENAQIDMLSINQSTLAMLLGIRRTGVSEVLSEFRDEGLITTGREAIVVADRDALSQRACSCWGEAISRRKQRLSGTAVGRRFVADLPVASLLKMYENS